MKSTFNTLISGGCSPVAHVELPTLVGTEKRELAFVPVAPPDKSSGGLQQVNQEDGRFQQIRRAYKFRIYPNKKQQAFLNQTMGCCRWLWNYALAKINEIEKQITKDTAKEEKKLLRKSVSVISISKEIPSLKKTKETQWLKEAISISLIQTLRNLDVAKENYFRNLKNGNIQKMKNSYILSRKKRGLDINKGKLFEIGKPKFRAKGHRQSCAFHQAYYLDFENSKINIPKCYGVPIVFHRKFDGTPKTVTIERTPSGKYFASILVEEMMFIPNEKKVKKETTLGIHNGISNFVTSDEEITIEKTNRFLRDSLQRIKVLSKRLSRKKEKSGRWERQRIQIAKLHEKIINQRNYLLHSVSNIIIRNPKYNTIALENWDKKEMMKNHIFSQAIADVSWERLITFIKYKAKWQGKTILELPPITANAKTCNKCGHLNEWVELKNREWICKKCGVKHKREINCAKNTKQMCLERFENQKNESK